MSEARKHEDPLLLAMRRLPDVEVRLYARGGVPVYAPLTFARQVTASIDAMLVDAEQRAERAEAERDRYAEREEAFSRGLRVADAGRYRADWPGAVETTIRRAERAEAAEQDAQADCDRRGERLWRLAAEAGWRPDNDADNDATAEAHILERLRDAERAEAELAALRDRSRALAWTFEALGKHAHADGLRDLLDDDTTGAASGEGEK